MKQKPCSRLFPLVSTAVLLASAPLIAQEDEEKKIPEPEKITLDSADGWLIRATYYPGTEGKDTVPVILLHGYGGSRGEYDAFATALQTIRGHAVIVPDLRGHGDSNTRKRPAKDEKPLKPEDLRAGHIGLMVTQDMEAVKKFLMGKNNAGELNIEQLCVVGADLGAIVAMNWVAQDWSWPALAGYKQGQDAKAVVLLSPKQTFKGATMRNALMHPFFQNKFPVKSSVLIAVGKKNSSEFSESKRIFSTLDRFHPTLREDEKVEKQAIFLLEPDTLLQGTQLLDSKLDVAKKVIGFIDLRLVNKKDDFKWTLRTSPVGN